MLQIISSLNVQVRTCDWFILSEASLPGIVCLFFPKWCHFIHVSVKTKLAEVSDQRVDQSNLPKRVLSLFRNNLTPTSRACRRKVLFSALAHSMHSRHSPTSWPVAASISRKRSSRERTSRAAFALLMEIRKGLTNFSRPPSSKKDTKRSFDERYTRCVLSSRWLWVSQRDTLPAAWPVLARRLPNSRMLCSLTLTASSSFSWTSLLTVRIRQQDKVNTINLTVSKYWKSF